MAVLGGTIVIAGSRGGCGGTIVIKENTVQLYA